MGGGKEFNIVLVAGVSIFIFPEDETEPNSATPVSRVSPNPSSSLAEGSDTLSKKIIVQGHENIWNSINRHCKAVGVSKAKWITHAMLKLMEEEQMVVFEKMGDGRGKMRSVYCRGVVGFWLLMCSFAAVSGYQEGAQAYAQGDYDTAMRELRPLAEQGNADAQSKLGVMYAEGRGVPEDDKEAARWFRKAAEQGYAKAQHNLGFMYNNGRGVPEDYKEAARWFRMAAEQGDAKAQSNLGWMYAEGRGVPEDYKEAARWYRMAAEQGDAEAQYNLGLMYASGLGVPEDYVLAYMWWNLAAASGVKDAAENRDRISKEMSSSQIEEAQRLSREWRAK